MYNFVRSPSVGTSPVSGCAEGTYVRSVRRARHDLRRPGVHCNARQVRTKAQPVAAERFEKAPEAPHRSGSEVSSRQAGIGESGRPRDQSASSFIFKYRQATFDYGRTLHKTFHLNPWFSYGTLLVLRTAKSLMLPLRIPDQWEEQLCASAPPTRSIGASPVVPFKATTHVLAPRQCCGKLWGRQRQHRQHKGSIAIKTVASVPSVPKKQKYS
jgi:hypothetical protein